MLGLVVFNTYISRWLDRYALCIWLVFVVNTFLMLAVVLQKLLTRLPWQTNCRFSSYLSLSVVHVSFFERFVISRRDNEHVGARGKCQVVRDGFEMWRQLVRIRRGVAPRIGVGGIWAKPQFTNITYRPGQLNWKFWLDIPQFGSLAIFLILWFYLKSVLAVLWGLKTAVLTIFTALNFEFWKNSTLEDVKSFQKLIIQSCSNGPNGSFLQLQNDQNWYHVKSERLKNPDFSTLCIPN